MCAYVLELSTTNQLLRPSRTEGWCRLKSGVGMKRTALITGAVGGRGQALAANFAATDWEPVVGSQDDDRLSQVHRQHLRAAADCSKARASPAHSCSCQITGDGAHRLRSLRWQYSAGSPGKIIRCGALTRPKSSHEWLRSTAAVDSLIRHIFDQPATMSNGPGFAPALRRPAAGHGA